MNNIIIVGAMANNFLAFNGFKVGKSLVEKNSSQIIEKYILKQKIYCNIIIPEDCRVSKDLKHWKIKKR